MTTPILYVFAISHYCEKARWALDYFGIPYHLKHCMIGMNRDIAKKLGATSGSLPFLATGDGVVAGSSAILDWAEAQNARGRPSLSGDNPVEIAAMEKRLDDKIGVHIRRYYYSNALLSDPKSVRPIFSRDLPLMQKIATTLGWSKIVPLMITKMDLGVEQGIQSRAIVADEFDWLDALLADGRPYLAGDIFTRADMTAASLLAPLVNPAKHPTYANLALPVAVSDSITQWKNRPCLAWVQRMYEQHR